MAKAHQLLGPISRQLCWLYDAWIIGGSSDYVGGRVDKIPVDIDIVVPLDRWIEASKLIPEGATANRFGGFKFKDGNLPVDVWADDLARIAAYNTSFLAYNPRFNKFLRT